MNTKPNANQYNPDPAYLRSLLKAAGLTQAEAAALLGLGDRVMRYYLSDVNSSGHRSAPYTVQYALEQLTIKKTHRSGLETTYLT